MIPLATFADLPVELGQSIILLAANSCALDDKPKLANLTRTSRGIHALVQPILSETVFVNSSNFLLVCATPGSFTSTHRLIVDDSTCDGDSLRTLVTSTPAFRKVEMFRGPLWMFHTLLSVCTPVRAVVTESGWYYAYGLRESSLSRLTHLSGRSSAFFLIQFIPSGIYSDLVQLSHLVLGYRNIHVQYSIIPMLPKLLALPKLEYLCVCVPSDWHNGMSKLSAFARDRNEPRLWASRETEDRLGLFDDKHCLIGEPLLHADAR
ncbi:hypothetical protein EXIGLDRAFT_734644 [Exidia glandulosa HHB12029]|uniref:F-box domain-containing protein n=1 Tax=Exidia glandulosa HHB12029 TaxID=1314781 RepID=A0A165K4W1_EXIGL|nr:hypothetical protein EXIGLDRAFT_734644 [Exidia glandulosa HHB12029]